MHNSVEFCKEQFGKFALTLRDTLLHPQNCWIVESLLFRLQMSFLFMNKNLSQVNSSAGVFELIFGGPECINRYHYQCKIECRLERKF